MNASEWREGDELIGLYDVWKIVSIGKKCWGKIPMGAQEKPMLASKCDPRCVGIDGPFPNGNGTFGLSADPERDGTQYSRYRIFREGKEIWHSDWMDKWPGRYQFEGMETPLDATITSRATEGK